MKNTPEGPRQPPNTLSFMVRLWRVSEGSSLGDDATVVWRASVQEALTGERIFFASFGDLVSFLRRQMGVTSGEAADDRNGAPTARNLSIPQD